MKKVFLTFGILCFSITFLAAHNNCASTYTGSTCFSDIKFDNEVCLCGERPQRVLVFAPHPDDDVIGCGGSIARHIKVGNKVVVVYMTSGDSGSIRYSKEELTAIRETEAQAAAKMLGVTRTLFLRNKDGYLTDEPSNIMAVVSLIRYYRPDIVYIPHKDDKAKDHIKTYDIVTEAVHRAAGPWFQECKGEPWKTRLVLCYEVWAPLGTINYVEDVSEYIETKVKALEMHASQIESINYAAAVQSLNQYRGIMTGRGNYCESFFIYQCLDSLIS